MTIEVIQNEEVAVVVVVVVIIIIAHLVHAGE
jgi:hypothetical protein